MKRQTIVKLASAVAISGVLLVIGTLLSRLIFHIETSEKVGSFRATVEVEIRYVVLRASVACSCACVGDRASGLGPRARARVSGIVPRAACSCA